MLEIQCRVKYPEKVKPYYFRKEEVTLKDGKYVWTGKRSNYNLLTQAHEPDLITGYALGYRGKSLRTMKSYVSRIRKAVADGEPYDFIIYEFDETLDECEREFTTLYTMDK